MSIDKLSTQLLMESCEKAKELNLENDFIEMLNNELNKRDIHFTANSSHQKLNV